MCQRPTHTWTPAIMKANTKQDGCRQNPLECGRGKYPAAPPHITLDSPFSLCWKEGENSLAVILAIRASSWAF